MTGQSSLPVVHEISANVTHLHSTLPVPFTCCATKSRQQLEIWDPVHILGRTAWSCANQGHNGTRPAVVCSAYRRCLCVWRSMCHHEVLARNMSLNCSWLQACSSTTSAHHAMHCRLASRAMSALSEAFETVLQFLELMQSDVSESSQNSPWLLAAIRAYGRQVTRL